VETRGQRHPASAPADRPRRLLVLLALACLAHAGCANFWDEVTSRDFHFKEMFAQRPDPLWVVRNSPDGDKRAKALRALQEPLAHGGSADEQEVVVQVLLYAAGKDTQPLCRLAAIQSLRKFKDPRAVDGLKDAYYRAGSFNPETANVIRCQALEALGETGSPAAVEVLVQVLREPPVEGPDPDRQQKLDERIAAAHALGHFKSYQATEALVAVLRTDQDVALRQRANESLQAATGKDFPADARVWAEFLHQPGNQEALAAQPGLPQKVLQLISGTK
jgi:HEAT repeats/PBS lyase HEAT-like repeat